jgi:hypothetical protein
LRQTDCDQTAGPPTRRETRSAAAIARRKDRGVYGKANAEASPLRRRRKEPNTKIPVTLRSRGSSSRLAEASPVGSAEPEDEVDSDLVYSDISDVSADLDGRIQELHLRYDQYNRHKREYAEIEAESERREIRLDAEYKDLSGEWKTLKQYM